LDADHDNLRAALEWGLTHEGAEVLRLAADLAPFWRWRGYRSEGRRWLTAALARAPADAAARGRALVGAAILAYDQGDGEALVAHASEAVEHCRRSGDAVGLGLALHRLALVPDADVVRREALVLEALALFESADFTCGIGEALSTLGNQAMACKDFARAEELHARALTAHRSVGNDRGAAAVLGFLGAVVEKHGDLSGARAFYEASLATGRPYGLHTQLSVMGALVRLADLAWFEGRGDEAHSMLREAVAEVRHMDSFSVGHAIHWTGVLDVRQGRSERGVSLMACAAAPWGSFGSPRDMTGADDVRSRYEASLAEARSALSPDRFARAWAEGERMSVEQAAALILAEPSRSA
jgi:non-specific serine/threonine protein kinase